MNSSNQFALGTFSSAGCPPFAGMVIDERVIAISALKSFAARSGLALTGQVSVLDLLDNWQQSFEVLSAAAKAVRSGQFSAELLAPVSALKVHVPLTPPQVFCCGANYRQHVIEYMVDLDVPEVRGYATREEKLAHAAKVMDQRAATGRPYVFTKVATAVTGPFDPVVLPAHVKQPDWELELAVIIGRPARHVSREQALDYIAGYTVANDTSARDWLFREDLKAMGTDWLACKSAPSWSPLGPYLVPAAFVPNPQNLRLVFKLNGETKQDGNTSDMIFDIAAQIEYLSKLTQLQPGDVICTGTPSGNGLHYGRYLQPGDIMESIIEGVGAQRNVCEAERTGQ